MKRIYFTLFLGIIFSFNVSAQEATFNIMAPDTVPPNEIFEITFVLKNAKGSDFDAPDFNGFYVVSGPNMSSSYSFMNGQSSQELSYTFLVKAKETGTKTIGQSSIVVNEKRLKTDWTKIAVIEGFKMPKKKDPFDDFFNRRDFFDMPESISPKEENPYQKKKSKKKKKTYRI